MTTAAGRSDDTTTHTQKTKQNQNDVTKKTNINNNKKLA